MLKEIKGKRINLRTPRKSDAASICRHVKDRAIGRYTFIPHPYTLEDAHEFIKRTHRARRRGIGFNFGVEDKQTGLIIGMVGLIAVNRTHQRGELGYWLGREFWGQGITVEAIHLALRFAFRELKLRRVYAHVFLPNTASVRVLEKAGFTCEGVLRKHMRRKNRYFDCYLYSILKEEWRSRRSNTRRQRRLPPRVASLKDVTEGLV